MIIFTDALRAALREDPDVVLIGEMRDLETIESALRIAETGHLTFGTLHTNSATSTINRIIDVFPAHQQPQIRAQLSLVLEGVMCQTLLPTPNGKGRTMIMEILIPNPAVRNLIREDKIHQVYSAMQSGQDKFGMQTFNQALATAYMQKQVSLETALQRTMLTSTEPTGTIPIAGAAAFRETRRGTPPRRRWRTCYGVGLKLHRYLPKYSSSRLLARASR